MSGDRVGIDPRELLLGLSNPALTDLIGAGVLEMAKRELPLPDVFGPVATKVIHDEQMGASLRLGLVNPLEEPEAHEPSELADGRIVVVHDNRRVEVDGKICRIIGKQYDVFAVLAANVGKIVGRGFLLQAVWQEQPTEQEIRREGGVTAKLRANLIRVRYKLGIDDLGHAEDGVIRNQHGEGWVALPSLSNCQPAQSEIS